MTNMQNRDKIPEKTMDLVPTFEESALCGELVNVVLVIVREVLDAGGRHEPGIILHWRLPRGMCCWSWPRVYDLNIWIQHKTIFIPGQEFKKFSEITLSGLGSTSYCTGQSLLQRGIDSKDFQKYFFQD